MLSYSFISILFPKKGNKSEETLIFMFIFPGGNNDFVFELDFKLNFDVDIKPEDIKGEAVDKAIEFVVGNLVGDSDIDDSVLKLVILEINKDDGDADGKEIEDVVVSCELASWLQKQVTEQLLSRALLQTEKT